MNSIYDYKSPEARVRTAQFLFDYAKSYRAEADERWQLCYAYYAGRHRTQLEIAESCRDAGIPWIAAMSPDPYLQVESQITSELPDFTFRGRDDDLDSVRARQREDVVRYILARNRVADEMASNDRRCLITGSSAWKVYWDEDDVRVAPVDPRFLYPDPSAKRLDECEYLQFVYPVHRRAFARMYGRELKRLDVDLDQLARAFDPYRTPEPETYTAQDDVIAVTEHWYRDEEGDICCSIQAGGYELRHIEKYWQRTAPYNTSYPFVIQYRVSNPDAFWGYGDIEPILTLVDAVDRELSIAQLSSAFLGSDIILAEHDAFSEEPENRPGALWRLKPGAMGKVARLGGFSGNAAHLETAARLREMISETLGTLDIDKGIVQTSLTSAAALSQLIERSDARSVPKKSERINAFARLYTLIDWTALEFYDEDRIIFLGAQNGGEPKVFTFNANNFMDERGYFPIVDAYVSAGDGMRQSNTFTLSAINALLGHQVTRENYPLVMDVLRLLGLERAGEIEEHFEKIFAEEEEKAEIEGTLQQPAPSDLGCDPAEMAESRKEIADGTENT